MTSKPRFRGFRSQKYGLNSQFFPHSSTPIPTRTALACSRHLSFFCQQKLLRFTLFSLSNWFEQITKRIIIIIWKYPNTKRYLGLNCSKGALKMCSDTMAATFMDFIKFGLDIKDLNQGQQIKWYLCQKFDTWPKILQKLPKKWEALEEIFLD